MRIVTVGMSADEAETIFPCSGPDGTKVRATELAELLARNALDRSTLNTPFAWHLPDAFSVRYGSNYIATATFGSERVRFVTDDGNGEWREGDDIGVEQE